MTMLNPSSVRIFAGVVANEPDADAQLFHRYLQRLCRLAQSRLAPRLARRIDAEDVVMSAYRSFFLNAKAGRFWIQESGDLWALLTKITLRKLYRSAAHHSAEMRSVNRETPLPESATFDEWILSEQPSAEDAVAMAEEVETVLRSLSSQHRRIVELRLQGELMEDIARELAISDRSVRRVLSDLETQMRVRHGIADKLYSMLTGRPPFTGHRTSDILTSVLCRIPDFPSDFRPDIPPDLDAFCLKSLAKKPCDRWTSMREFLRNLPSDQTDHTP